MPHTNSNHKGWYIHTCANDNNVPKQKNDSILIIGKAMHSGMACIMSAFQESLGIWLINFGCWSSFILFWSEGSDGSVVSYCKMLSYNGLTSDDNVFVETDLGRVPLELSEDGACMECLWWFDSITQYKHCINDKFIYVNTNTIQVLCILTKGCFLSV